jgi:protein phosphatase
MGRVKVSGRTDAGRARANNQDSWISLPEYQMAAVADGMGGEACGEVASAITVEALRDVFAKKGEGGNRLEYLQEAAREANARVLGEAVKQPACAGMGSTLVAVTWSGSKFDILNVGDSRAYLLRDGVLSQLTYDQNLGNELKDSMGWSDEQVRGFPQRAVLTAAIGATREVQMRAAAVELHAGDRLLLCSDGLYNPVGDVGMELMLNASVNSEEALSVLIDSANLAGGPDNITAVLLEYSE